MNTNVCVRSESFYTLSEAEKILRKRKIKKMKALLIRSLIRIFCIMLITLSLYIGLMNKGEDGTGMLLAALIGLVVFIKPEWLGKR